MGQHLKTNTLNKSNHSSGKKAVQVPKLNLGAGGKTLSGKKNSIARNINQYYQS